MMKVKRQSRVFKGREWSRPKTWTPLPLEFLCRSTRFRRCSKNPLQPIHSFRCEHAFVSIWKPFKNVFKVLAQSERIDFSVKAYIAVNTRRMLPTEVLNKQLFSQTGKHVQKPFVGNSPCTLPLSGQMYWKENDPLLCTPSLWFHTVHTLFRGARPVWRRGALCSYRPSQIQQPLCAPPHSYADSLFHCVCGVLQNGPTRSAVRWTSRGNHSSVARSSVRKVAIGCPKRR